MEDLEAALNGITPQQRRFQPTRAANHSDYIAWRIARMEDNIINRRIRRRLRRSKNG